MSYSTVVKTVRDGKITISDNGGTSLEVAYEGEGNFSFDGEKLAARVAIFDRGTVVGVRKGADPEFITASFDVNLRMLSSGHTGSVLDFINKTNAYAGLVSTSSDSDFFTVNLTYEIEGTALGDATDSKVTLTNCVATYSVQEATPSTATLTFECFGTVTRESYTS
jgi:hypothetical protein